VHVAVSPVVLFPYAAGYATGPLWRLFGISTHTQITVMIYLIMCQTNSVMLTFYWRLQVGLAFHFLQKKHRRPRNSQAHRGNSSVERMSCSGFFFTSSVWCQLLLVGLLSLNLALSFLAETSTIFYINELNKFLLVSIYLGIAYIAFAMSICLTAAGVT